MGFRPYFPYEHSSEGMSAIMELIADTLIFHTVFPVKSNRLRKAGRSRNGSYQTCKKNEIAKD
jgi:hypothetical protein